MSAVLELKGIRKKFGGIVVADDINMEMHPAEIKGLIGPNGAGKTTLMNIISGIYEPDGGEIFLNGENITAAPAHKRAHMGIARTFQSPRFLHRSTIRDNLMMGTDLAKHQGYLRSFFSKRESAFHQELDYYMQYAGFEIDLEKDISSLTYGQMKILEIIRSLLTHPMVMLVDEPAAGLNQTEEQNAVRLLHIAAEKKNISILLIEHSMDLVMNHCKDIVVLNFGKILTIGTAEEVSANHDVIEAYLGRDTDEDQD